MLIAIVRFDEFQGLMSIEEKISVVKVIDVPDYSYGIREAERLNAIVAGKSIKYFAQVTRQWITDVAGNELTLKGKFHD